MNSIPIAVPPAAEQRRIIARVDELMAVCDRLEAVQQERETRRKRIAGRSLERLSGPADVQQLREHAAFHFTHFRRFTDRIEDVKELRQTILSLAVRGRLTARESQDEPVRRVIRGVGVEDTLEGPFSLPSTWAWTSVGAAGDARLGKMLDKAKNKGTFRRYLRNVNVRWFDFDLSDVFDMRFEEDELDEHLAITSKTRRMNGSGTSA
jgi:type I restriction enzyme S subunit